MTTSTSPDQSASGTLSANTLTNLCAAHAGAVATSPASYRPTHHQITFFTLIWAAELGAALAPADSLLTDKEGNSIDGLLAKEQIRYIANILDDWGDMVTSLQQGNAREWELLRIQMEKAVRRILRGSANDDAADALQKALLKIFEMLMQIAPAAEIERATDIVALVMAKLPSQKAIFRFHRPFYPYAKRIVENYFYSIMREIKYHPTVDWETMEEHLEAPGDLSEGVTADDPTDDAKDATSAVALRHLLAQELTRLLQMIQSELTPTPRIVVLTTLAARPQFWATITLSGAAWPQGLEALPEQTTDAEMALLLNTDVNSLRVHRSQARRTIDGLDSFLGLLLDSLMTPGKRMGRYLELRRILLDTLHSTG